jgi:histidine triad (HIT) family protein
MSDCIFCKIVAGEIPGSKVYEDDEMLAFDDIHPFARVHFLIIPKMHIASLADCTLEHEGLLGRMLLLAPRLAMQQGLEAGFKTLINTGRGGGQEVFHIHVHVFGGGDPVKRS